MAFIDLCHRENIGVIMDYVPVHFALDSYSLGRFGVVHFMNIQVTTLDILNGALIALIITEAK